MLYINHIALSYDVCLCSNLCVDLRLPTHVYDFIGNSMTVIVFRPYSREKHIRKKLFEYATYFPHPHNSVSSSLLHVHFSLFYFIHDYDRRKRLHLILCHQDNSEIIR